MASTGKYMGWEGTGRERRATRWEGGQMAAKKAEGQMVLGRACSGTVRGLRRWLPRGRASQRSGWHSVRLVLQLGRS